MPGPDISEMEVRVNPRTREALQNDGTLRCLLPIRYTQDDHKPEAVIPWARSKATEVSRNLLQGAGLGAETATFTVDLNGYMLRERHRRSYICYDIFLERCSREVRDKIEGTTRQPIHVITNRGNVLIARREPNCDNKVAHYFEMVRAGKRSDEILSESTMKSIGDHAQNKLGSIIQDAAERIVKYVDGTLGEHTINPLELQLYMTRAMISGSEDNFNNFAVKNIDPVADKDARFAAANVATFLLRSFRAQKESDKFKEILEQNAEKLEKEIEDKTTVESRASEDEKIDAEQDQAGRTAD